MSIDYYKILGLTPTCNHEEIEDAYNSLARKWHPDANPKQQKKSNDKFNKITKAYQCLSNPEQRRDHDIKLGYRSSLDNSSTLGNARIITFSSNNNDGAHRFLQQIFSGGTAGSSPSPTNVRSSCKEDDIIKHMIKLSLEDIYQGCDRRLEKVSIGGQIKLITVPIPPGCPEGHIITVTKGETLINCEILSKPHSIYKRKGHDLYMKHTVTLRDFINGFEIYIDTLDGKRKRVRQKRNNIVITGIDPIKVTGLGMPNPDAGNSGDLYIELCVELPESY